MSSVNRSELKIESLNHTRILNKLMRASIKVIGCVKEFKLLTIIVCSKDLARVRSLFDENGYNYIISRQIGPYHTFKSTIKRYGIFVGLALAITFLVLISSLVININISGLENVKITEINQIIIDNNIKKFMFKSSINLSRLNSSLCEHEGVASVSINIKGVNLNIRVQEELYKDKYFIDGEKGVFAMYDTIITQIIVESGTAVVKSGDTVKAGALLIAPFYNLDEEHTVDVPARGEVYGRIWIKNNIYFHSEQIEMVKTGKKVTKSELYIAGFAIGKKPSVPFPLFEKTMRKLKFNNLIPIDVIYHTFFELEKRLVVRDFEKEKDLLIMDKEQEIEKNIDTDKSIIRKWNIIKNIDKTYIISIYYELEGRIDAVSTKGEMNANRSISY